MKAHYEEIEVSGALNRVRNMSFNWSLNPYQGCVHGCHYCFARRYHWFKDLNPGDDFSGVIFVKTNLPEKLLRELSRSSWKFEPVAVGTATDPYQPIEGKYRITRRCMEVFCAKRNPIRMITKGTMIVRDIDVLSELARVAGCTVCFSMTVLDDALRSKLEPGTPPTIKRLKAMEKLAEAGVNSGVLIAPIIPGVTDKKSNLEPLATAAVDHGARFLEGSTLYLMDGTKGHFLKFLNSEFPNLIPSYRTVYSGAFAPGRVKDRHRWMMREMKEKYGLEDMKSDDSADRPRQLTLAI